MAESLKRYARRPPPGIDIEFQLIMISKKIFTYKINISTWDAAARRRIVFWTVVAAGLAFRTGEYVRDRGLWLDESSIRENITARPLGARFTNNQAAPIGFMMIEKMLLYTLGSSSRALRLNPYLAACLTVWAFAAIARKDLDSAAGLIASALVATSDNLIYYADELKPYSGDVLAAVASIWIGLETIQPNVSYKRLAIAFAAGGIALWSSFPAVFCVAAAGLAAIRAALRLRDPARLKIAIVMNLGWILVFIPFYFVSRRMLQRGTVLWDFWNFAFPPSGGSFAAVVRWVSAAFVDAFINPIGRSIPAIDARIAVIPALALFALGAAASFADSAEKALIRLGPIAFTLGASMLRLYPFHGRLLLFLVPCFYLTIARGWNVLASAFRGSPCGKIAAFFLLAFPAFEAVRYGIEPRTRAGFNATGDYRDEPILKLDMIKQSDKRL